MCKFDDEWKCLRSFARVRLSFGRTKVWKEGFFFFSGKVQSESIRSESKNGSFSKDKAHTEAVYILFDTVHYLAVQQTISIYNEPLLDNKRNARIYFKLLRNMRE